MISQRDRGLTLLELLTAMLIVAILIALLLPVIHSARYRAGDSQCISNMRQILMALNMYRADYREGFPGDERKGFPRGLRFILPYTKSKDIFRCPVARFDDGAGMYFLRGWEGIEQLTYYYFVNHTRVYSFLKHIQELDPNHGVLACMGHPASNLRYASMLEAPHVRRGLLDGSVQTVRKRVPTPEEVGEERHPWGNGCFNGWVLYTNAPCPARYCLHPNCGEE